MIFRTLDVNGDWNFGRGANDFATGQNAVALDIQTRLNSFLGDCFFDLGAGIDWFNLLGAKSQTALNLAIGATLLNTDSVTGINNLYINLDNARRVTISYGVQTTYGVLSNVYKYNVS